MEQPGLLTGCIIALHDRGWHRSYDFDTDSWGPSKNPELLAMAEACGDPEAAKAKAQANMRAAEAEKAAAATESTGAPKTDLPLTPAARDGAGGKEGKAKNQKGPAARTAGSGKLDAAAATAGIATALQALSGNQNQARPWPRRITKAGPVAAEAAQAPVLVKLKRSALAAPADTPASKLRRAGIR